MASTFLAVALAVAPWRLYLLTGTDDESAGQEDGTVPSMTLCRSMQGKTVFKCRSQDVM